MPLTPGSKLGPYEILAPLGSGGMGEVYRAKDSRLGRDVAVKVLPAAFSADEDRLRRFEQEARAAGLLNHPNILAIYDIGTENGAPYVVSELLEGETLRGRLAGSALPPRRAIEYAISIAQGLAAAHEKGIVHRDLKPENVFITADGRVKILDFGLAKLTREDDGTQTNLPTATAGTEPGVVLGTLGYMAPEQVRGKPADSRSDIFAFGAILYEMLAGRRAFHGDTAADTMSAILKEEPVELSATGSAIPPALDRIVRHCLEKSPEQRFQSARDLAFDLETLTGVSTPVIAPIPEADAGASARKRRILPALTVLLLLAAGIAAGALLFGRRAADSPKFQQITFRRGSLRNAFFAGDPATVAYVAAWDGGPHRAYLGRVGVPEATPLEITGLADIEAVRQGELAILLSRPGVDTLARVPITGGSPRPIVDEIDSAHWSPDGKAFAIVQGRSGRTVLEYPEGKALYDTGGNIRSPRISPDGERVAFFDNPILGDDRGTVAVVDRAGKKTTLTRQFASTEGLAWHPGGKEIWFGGTEVGSHTAVHAVTPSGKLRVVLRAPGRLAVQDISPDGRLLLSSKRMRGVVMFRGPGEARARELSWLDYSVLRDLSPDGKTVLIEEGGEGGGENYGVYIRPTDGTAATRLGQGRAMGISPDGRWIATIPPSQPDRIVLLPRGAGRPRELPRTGLQYLGTIWMPDSKRLLVGGSRSGEPIRLWMQDIEGSAPRRVGPDSIGDAPVVSRDGRHFLSSAAGRVQIHTLEGNEPSRDVPGFEPSDDVIGWSADQRWAIVRAPGLPMRLYRIDISNGRRELWKEETPPDAAGLGQPRDVFLSEDHTALAYGYRQALAELFVVDGLR